MVQLTSQVSTVSLADVLKVYNCVLFFKVSICAVMKHFWLHKIISA